MKIGIASDHHGIEERKKLVSYFKEQGYDMVDYGPDDIINVDYPLYAFKVSKDVAAKNIDLGILMCGTGIGISISANKVPGVIAAVCSEPYSARMTKMHNNANIIAFGARVVGDEMAKMILDEFFETEFEGGRHAGRVELIKKIEADYSK